MAFYASRLSEHLSESPEGFLIAHDAVLCRTAVRTPQLYRGDELGLRTAESVKVFRSPQQVMSKKFLASLNGKPITDSHPSQFLNAQNSGWLIKGHAQNIRPGPRLPDGEESVIGDLVVTDAALIEKIKNGTRELSVGYQCEYRDNGDGTFSQVQLRANHIAVVPDGRAGEHVRILDAMREPQEDFAAIARQYHRAANPAEVSAQRARRSRPATDSLTEEMKRAGAPRSFDELAEEIHARYQPEEIPMPNKKKTDDEEQNAIERLTTAVTRLTALLGAREAARRIDEEEESEEVVDSPTLVALRRIRPFVVSNGSPEQKRAFNDAVRAAKRDATYRGEIVEAADWWRRVPVDEHKLRGPSADSDYAAEMNRAGAKMRGDAEHEAPEKPFGVRTADSTSRTNDEEWGRDVRREYHRKPSVRR